MGQSYEEFKDEFDRQWAADIEACEEAGIEVLNIKLALDLSDETIAGTADLYWNGELVGRCENHGHGDPYEARFTRSMNMREAMYAEIEKHGTGINGGSALETYIADCFGKAEEQEEMKREARRGFCFRKPGMEKGQYYQRAWPKPVSGGRLTLADKIALFERFTRGNGKDCEGIVAYHPKDGREVAFT